MSVGQDVPNPLATDNQDEAQGLVVKDQLPPHRPLSERNGTRASEARTQGYARGGVKEGVMLSMVEASLGRFLGCVRNDMDAFGMTCPPHRAFPSIPRSLAVLVRALFTL